MFPEYLIQCFEENADEVLADLEEQRELDFYQSSIIDCESE